MGTQLHGRFVAQPNPTYPPLIVSTASLPNAAIGVAYSAPLAAAGGKAPYTWSLLSVVPDTGGWLSCSSAGVLSGTPTAPELEIVLVQVIDANGAKASRFLALTVAGTPLLISTSSPLPGATAGSSYSFLMTASGGTAPYTWAITADSPNTGGWLSISSSGLLGGTPTTVEIESLTIRVTDSVGSTASAPFSLTVHAAASLAAPWIAAIASGGDASFGQATTTGFTSYSAAAPGTPAYIATQQLGANDLIVNLGGSFEGWGTSASGRTRSDLVNTIKGKGAHPNVKNAARTPYVFQYSNMESQTTTGSGYQTYVNLVVANNWWLYETTGGSGTIVPSVASGGTYQNVNYAYAWPTAAGTVPLGFTICGNAYGTQSNSQGPARTAAEYFVALFLTQNRIDSRFTSLPLNGAASNLDGLYLDNMFAYPNAGGNLVAHASWDGQNLQTNATIAAYPSGASSLLADGQAQFFATMQNVLLNSNPGQAYLNFGNLGSYANITSNGDTKAATGNALTGVMNGGLCEAVFGINGPSWQTYQTPAEVLANIDWEMSALAAPQLLCVGTRFPATDGSSTVSFVTGGSVQTVATGTALEYQMMRCALCLCLMRNIYLAHGTAGYNYALDRWYDEYGDDSLTQVNVKRGYLGQAVGAAITLSNGVMARQFTGGVALFNGWGNGVQTVTAAMITAAFGVSCKLLAGTQQPTINTGATFSSRAMADGDGLVLLVQVIATLAITTTSPLPSATVGTAYSATLVATGGVLPYAWSIVSDTPDTGSWLSINASTGVLSGTPGTAETESLVIKVVDSTSTAVSAPFSLTVKPISAFAPIQYFVADAFVQGTNPVVSGGGPDGQLYSRYGSASGQKYGMVTANATSPTFNAQTTNFIRPGHTQSFQVSIQKGTSGFPADGETPSTNGMWGFLLEPPTYSTTGYGQQGDWVHGGMWMYVQSTTQLRTTSLEAGAIKFFRSSYPTTTASKDDCHICEQPAGFAFLNEYDPNNTANNNYPDERAGTELGLPRDGWHFFEFGVLLNANGDVAIRRQWMDNVLQTERNGRVIKWRTTDGVYHTTTLSSVGVPSLPSASAALQEFFIFTYWNAHPAVDTVIWMDGIITANESRTTFNAVDNLGNPIIGSGNSP